MNIFKTLNAPVMINTSIVTVGVIIPSEENDDPHVLKPTLCILSGEVVQYTCSCVAGKTGFCNHALTLMLKFVSILCMKVKLHSICIMILTKILIPNKPCTSDFRHRTEKEGI